MRNVTAVLAGCLLLSACSDQCANTIVARLPSPDADRDAVMFQRDCGATTGFSTQISIVASGEMPTGGGNAFRADDDHGAATVGKWGGPWAAMQWLAPDHLVVQYAAGSRIFEQDESAAGVRMTFEAVNRQPGSGP